MARSKSSSRVEIYIRLQDPSLGNPAHRCGQQLAALVVVFKLAYWVKTREKTAIHLVTDEAWALTKNRFREAERRHVPRIAPALPLYPAFMQSYPPVWQETNGRRLQAEVWKRAESF